jgi:hypothetical protein
MRRPGGVSGGENPRLNGASRSARCVVSLVDRLVHNAEIVAIEGDSYRLKEARERADARARKRRGAKS